MQLIGAAAGPRLFLAVCCVLAQIAVFAQTQEVKNLVSQGNGLYLQRNYAGAIAKYDEAIALDATYAAAHNNRGLALERTGSHAAAVAAFGQALAIAPADKRIHLSMGKAHALNDEFTSAIACFDAALALDSSYKEALFNRGWCRDAQGQYAAAVADYEAAVAVDDTYARAMTALGIALARQGATDDAVWWFLRAVACTRSRPAASSDNALARRNLRIVRGYDFDCAVTTSPAAIDAAIRLMEKEGYTTAAAQLEAVVQADPQVPMALDCYARSLRLANPSDPRAAQAETSAALMLPAARYQTILPGADAFHDYYRVGNTPASVQAFAGYYDYATHDASRVSSATVHVEQGTTSVFSIDLGAPPSIDTARLVRGSAITTSPNAIDSGATHTLDLAELMSVCAMHSLGVVTDQQLAAQNLQIVRRTGFFSGKETTCTADLATSGTGITAGRTHATLDAGNTGLEFHADTSIETHTDPFELTIAWTSGMTTGSFVLVVDPDTDNDGLLNSYEVGRGYDPAHADTDRDGLGDGWEDRNGLDALAFGDADADLDADGVSNYSEWALGSDPRNAAVPAALHVDPVGGSDTVGDGSEGLPYATVQKAIDAVAATPAVVRIAAGVSTETIVLRHGVAIVGAGPSPESGTVINANNAGRAVLVPADAAVVVANLRITGGSIPGGDGAGILASGVACRVSLNQVDIVGNRRTAGFGHGAGMFLNRGLLRAARCRFLNNANAVAQGYGGGLYMGDATARLYECLFAHNSAPIGYGADGLGAHNCNVELANCTVADNERQGFYSYGTSATLRNCILWGNGDDVVSPSSQVALNHCCIEDNDTGTSITHAAPRFIDPEDNDYRLKPGSPCIDAADGGAIEPADIDLQPRWDDPATTDTGCGPVTFADIGCCEMIDTDGDGMNDRWEEDQFGNLDHDGTEDTDGDGLDDATESERGTDPNVASPHVLAITRMDSAYTSASTVRCSVSFTTSVLNVDAGDFALVTTGLSGVSIGGVSGSGAVYTVTINTGSGNGQIRLDLVDNNTITDGGGVLLGGPGTADGMYRLGDSYVIDRIAPTITVDPTARPFFPQIVVTLSPADNSGAVNAYFTRDGSDPLTSPLAEASTGSVTLSSSTWLRYAARDAAGNVSAIGSQRYNFPLFVDPAGGSNTTGTGSMAAPFATPGAALSTISGSSVSNEFWILVAQGRTTGTVDLRGYVELRGGYQAGTWVRDIARHVSIIDGENVRPCVRGVNFGRIGGFTLVNGRSNTDGGGLQCGGFVVAEKLTIRNCHANVGGGISAFYHAPQVENCLITSCSATVKGGGVYTDQTGLSLRNCTIYGNQGGVIANTPSLVQVRDCIIWNNGDDISNYAAGCVKYCNIEDGDYLGTDGNISADPQFWNAAGGDFRLNGCSPCIDVADPASTVNTDIAGVARPSGAARDMGCHEWNAALPACPASPSPEDLALDAALNEALGWDGGSLADAYNVYLWKPPSARPTTPTAIGLAAHEYKPVPPLDRGTTYSWQVISRNAEGETSGPVWALSTFLRATGTVHIQGCPGNARWWLQDGDNVERSGVGPQVLNSVPAGQVRVVWEYVPGYAVPVPQHVTKTLLRNGTVVFEAVYVPFNRVDMEWQLLE